MMYQGSFMLNIYRHVSHVHSVGKYFGILLPASSFQLYAWIMDILHDPLTHLRLLGLSPMSRRSSGHKCTSCSSLEYGVYRRKCWWLTWSNASSHRQFWKIPYGFTQLECHRKHCRLILFDIVEHSSVHPLASDRAKIHFVSFGYCDVWFLFIIVLILLCNSILFQCRIISDRRLPQVL